MPVVNSVEANGAGITVAPNLGDVVIRNTGILDIFGGYGITSTYTWNDISGYVYTLTKVPLPPLPSPRTIVASTTNKVIKGDGNYSILTTVNIPDSWKSASSGVNVIEVQATFGLKCFGDFLFIYVDGDGALGVGCGADGVMTQTKPTLPVPGIGGDSTVNSWYSTRFRLVRGTDFSATSTSVNIFVVGGFEWAYYFSVRIKDTYPLPTITDYLPIETAITCLP